MNRNYKSLSVRRSIIYILVFLLCSPVFPVVAFADSGNTFDAVQASDPANNSQQLDSVNDKGTDLYDDHIQDSQSAVEDSVVDDSVDSKATEPEDGDNGGDDQITKTEDADSSKDLQATEPEDVDDAADFQAAEPEDEAKNSQTSESENGDSDSQAVESKDEDEDSQAADQKDEDVASNKPESTPSIAPELTDDPEDSEEEYGDEDAAANESILNIVSFELIFDEALMKLLSADNDDANFICGFGLLLTDTENDLEYSFILSSENNRIEIPNGTYSVAAGSIAPMGYQITDIPSELVIDINQEENLVIPISCGKGGRRGFFTSAVCELIIIGNEDAQSLVSAIEFDGFLESDMTVEGEDPLLEQELPGEPDPESLIESENETDLTSSLSADESVFEELEKNDAITEDPPEDEPPDLIDPDNSVSPPGQEDQTELLDGSDFEGQRLSDLPGHTDYSDSDADLSDLK